MTGLQEADAPGVAGLSLLAGVGSGCGARLQQAGPGRQRA